MSRKNVLVQFDVTCTANSCAVFLGFFCFIERFFIEKQVADSQGGPVQEMFLLSTWLAGTKIVAAAKQFTQPGPPFAHWPADA